MGLRIGSRMAAQSAKITLRKSVDRGHGDHGWLNAYHTFSCASYYDPNFVTFGSLRVLDEDRVAPGTGFPTHPHKDAEILSYILSGELTHRDSLVKKGSENLPKRRDGFSRLRRGDVQFTTAGRGMAHSEVNESADEWVRFLQVWALPWQRGLTPRYHTGHFSDEEKRKAFVSILSPLKAGYEASERQEEEATPAVAGSIPVHADLTMGAGLIGCGRKFIWTVGGVDDKGRSATTSAAARKIYIHLVMTDTGRALVKLNGQETKILNEGDGAFVEGLDSGDSLLVENIGTIEAEVIVFDSA